MLLLILAIFLVLFVALAIDGFSFGRIQHRLRSEMGDLPFWIPGLAFVLLVLAIVTSGKSPTQ